MPWGRILLGVVVTALLLAGLIGLYVVSGDRAFDSGRLGLSEQDRAALTKPFNDLVAGRDAELISSLVPGVDPAQSQAEVDRLQSLLPVGETPTTRIVNWRVTTGTNGNWLTAIAEHSYDDHVARSETVLTRSAADARWQVQGFNFNIAPRSELPSPGVSLSGRSAGYIAVVVAAAIVPIFILATFWAALFWKNLKPRWLWLIGVLFGVGAFSLNASTGEIGFNAFSFLLFGGSAVWSGSAFDAWIIGVAHPIGAVLFWLTRLMKQPA
jgi:hypothetical protein